MTRLSLGILRVYRVTLSPVIALLGSCRYQPTCSEYAQEALRLHGFRRGWWLAVRRVARCAPWGGHGYDPVPEEYVSWRQRRRGRQAERAARGPA